MPLASRIVRMLAAVSAVCFLGVALALCALNDGALEQYSGTALYASIVYATVVFGWPRIDSFVAGGIAVGL